jgi:hypothetical protein
MALSSTDKVSILWGVIGIGLLAAAARAAATDRRALVLGGVGGLLAATGIIRGHDTLTGIASILGAGLVTYTLWHFSPSLRQYRAPWTKYALGAAAFVALAALIWQLVYAPAV